MRGLDCVGEFCKGVEKEFLSVCGWMRMTVKSSQGDYYYFCCPLCANYTTWKYIYYKIYDKDVLNTNIPKNLVV